MFITLYSFQTWDRRLPKYFNFENLMLESISEFFNLQRSIPKKVEMKKIITSASNVSTLYLLNFCAKIDCKNGY